MIASLMTFTDMAGTFFLQNSVLGSEGKSLGPNISKETLFFMEMIGGHLAF